MTKRVTIPVLLLLIAFVVGAGLVVYQANEREEDALQRPGVMGVELQGPAPEGETSEEGWQHHAWGGEGDEAGGARDRSGNAPPGHGHDGLIQAHASDDDSYDPQMRAMHRSFRLEGDAGVAGLPFSPSRHEARIVESEGSLGSSPSDSCEVRMLPVQTSQFNCLVRVMCGGRVLYPNPEQTAGYAPCDVEDGIAVRARDDGHTAADGDPLVSVDLHAGIVTIEDRGDGVAPFRATLRLGRPML